MTPCNRFSGNESAHARRRGEGRMANTLSGPAACCRFTPSCSAYAVTALERYGAARGSWLALRRLARCHPWNPGGYDPVPDRNQRQVTD